MISGHQASAVSFGLNLFPNMVIGREKILTPSEVQYIAEQYNTVNESILKTVQ